ncbi:MAG: class II aldolase/adducin family protein [Woeseiaceae bacterium]|nr:class II aldolase/adducin family protein [Woeseiaceae bacterium]
MIDEGYIKFESRWQKTAPLQHDAIDILNRWRRPLYDAGLIGHYQELNVGYGNLSVRLAGTAQFIISGTQTGHIVETGPQHYALVEQFDIDANCVTSRGACEASSESLTHAALYALDQQIAAVVHAHSDKIWEQLRGSAPTTASDVAYGTPEMAYEFARLWNESEFPVSGIAVMAGHESGVVSIGRDLQEAAERMLAIAARYKN